MSSVEFAEIMAYYTLEPWGAERDNLHAGLIASTVANVHRNPKVRRDPYLAKDFVLKFGKQDRIDPKKLYNQFRAAAASAGIQIVRNNGNHR